MQADPIFTSRMVFSAGQPIRVYGTGEGTAEITFAGETRTAIAAQGVWEVEFPPMAYGGPYVLTMKLPYGEEILEDIYVGEVYLMAGQSNMQFKLKESNAPKELYRKNPYLRMFSTDRLEKSDRFTPADGWVTAEEDSVRDWSALGYLAGDLISRRKHIAVGIITCYQGASVIESWLPKGILAEHGIALSPKVLHGDHFYHEFSLWNGEGVLHDFALSQAVPFGLSGVVWYQGESNATPAEGEVYFKELELFIGTLRKEFRREDLPVAVVCLADNVDREQVGWKAVQKAQIQAGEAIPYVKTVLCADICETDQIHPPTKHLLAERIADVF